MRVRHRLLRRLRRAPAPAPRPLEEHAAAPHVRLLSERLEADDAWIDQLRQPEPADARATLDFEDPDDVVVELRRPGWSGGSEIETAPDDAEILSPADVLERSGARNLPARSLERMVFEVALRNEIVSQRVERIERRLDDLANQVFDAATQCDLIEVEARRARLAAEVTRLAVELRAEIDGGLTRLAREMAELVARRGEVDAAPRPPIAPPVALSDLAQLDTLPGDLIGRPGPFAASAG